MKKEEKFNLKMKIVIEKYSNAEALKMGKRSELVVKESQHLITRGEAKALGFNINK
jgi:hypothetical protein